MKTNKAIKELLLGFIVMAPLVYYMFLWSSLPEIIPVHFDGNGNPDKYGSRNYIAITVFFLTVVIYLILKYIPKIDPKNNFALFSKTYYKLRLILSLFFSILGFIIICSAQQGRVSVSLLYIIIAFFISIIGNYLGTIRPNYSVGIRSPWTLKNESIWRKVHYFAGKLWFFSGIFLGLLMIFLPAHLRTPVFFAIVLLLAGIPYLYSYSIYLKINK
ncbi:MAG: SdpI family protein [Bacteroidales bacterium]|nr:SdpI family protein [Bacteroidales bacterium]